MPRKIYSLLKASCPHIVPSRKAAVGNFTFKDPGKDARAPLKNRAAPQSFCGVVLEFGECITTNYIVFEGSSTVGG